MPGAASIPATVANALSERDFQVQVLELATDRGWLIHSRPPELDTECPFSTPEQPLLPEFTSLGESLVGTQLCALTVDGNPATKARPRFAKGHTYTDSKTKQAEERVRWELLAAGVQTDVDHLLAVNLLFRTDTQRRDVDNLAKLVLDACNGVAWRDDFQVVDLHARVDRGSAVLGFDLEVWRVGRYTGDCKGCGKALNDYDKRTDWSRRSYCSRACYDRCQRSLPILACWECGRAIHRHVRPGWIRVFCGNECKSGYLQGRRSIRDKGGFPDLVLARPPQLLFVELKTENGQLLEDQREWLALLEACGVETHVWRPSDWPEIQKRLMR